MNINNHMFPELGVRDKTDNSSGFRLANSNSKETTVRENLLFVDSRDCVGIQSVKDSKIYALSIGLRDNFTTSVVTTTGLGVSPVVISIPSIQVGSTSLTTILKAGDKVTINGVQGNKSVNGTWEITNVIVNTSPAPSTFELIGVSSSGDYLGSGIVRRYADSAFPVVKNNANIIVGNEMTIYLPKTLKSLRSISLVHTVIPRDIIPLVTYLPDFVSFSQFVEGSVPSCPTVRIATTANGTLATDFEIGDTVDGVVIVENDRILIKNQTSADENGIYVAKIVLGVGSLVRASDLPDTTPSEIANNYYVVVSEGTVNAGLTYVITMAAAGSVGTNTMTLTNIPAGIPISWASYIPQEENFLTENAIGFYSTPLQLFRTYFDSPFAIPNNNTPPPLRLWNPTVGGATHQLQPYPQQTVPTYTTDTFTVTDQTGLFYLILSGYGLYDLNDWTYRLSEDHLVNNNITSLMRVILLLTIAQEQTYRGVDYVDLIVNALVVDSSFDPLEYYGYGDFQRFLPGPGLGMNYQPGTSDGADPTVTRTDSPVPFPYYRGNVWGPYGSPGDRFQRMGLRDTVQDLYLNGDLNNLFGVSIVKSWVNARCIPTDVSYGIDLTYFSYVTFGNVLDSTNPNITNAMRLSSNGFGALRVNNLGNDSTYTEKFLNAGGQGPDPHGEPVDGYSTAPGGGSWVTTEVIDGGTGQFDDAIAAGPQYANTATNTTASGADATYTGDDGTPKITRQTAWYDSGTRNGDFKNQMFSYRNWIVTELPDTNLLITIFQAQRNQRVQSSNQTNSTAIFNCPIRLNLGTNTGTREYVESVESLLASSQLYWDNRFLPSDESLQKVTLSFTSFDGIPIPLEKMLQYRKAVTIKQKYNSLVEPYANYVEEFTNNIFRKSKVQDVFDPLDPRLFKRQKRNIGLIFKIETYEHDNPGLYAGIADNGNDDSFVTANSIY
jgi:hypothetical protein